jgi:hypothetical protein
MIVIDLEDPGELDGLLEAEAYRSFTQEQAGQSE